MENMELIKPQVEILMATYNGEKYIGEQIESILSQSYTNWNIRISDDCSKDKTAEIIKKYAEEYPEKIEIIENKSPSGSAKNNFFRLLGISTGEYIMCCDQDDIWKPKKIENTLKKLLEAEEETSKNTPILVFTDLTVVDENMAVINPSFGAMSKLNCENTEINGLLLQNTVTGCTTMFNKAACDLAKKAEHFEKITMHDGWLALIAAFFGRLVYLDEQTINYRQHTDNSVGAKSVTSPSYIFNKLFKNNNLKESMAAMVTQAREFRDCYGYKIVGDKKLVLDAFCSLSEKNKLERLRLMNKYRLYKSGLFRRIAQYIWG